MDRAAQRLLDAVCDTARACGSEARVQRRDPRVEIEPEHDDGFAVVVEATDDAVCVHLGSWVRRFGRHSDPDDDHDALSLAHDLVAAALWGRARLTVERVGDAVWRTTVAFGAPGRWLTFERVGGGLRLPWRKVTTRQLVNRGRPPKPIVEKQLRPLPWAPWAGMRGESPPAPPPQALPVDGELDLHPFSPKEVAPLLREYIEQCQARGITELRVVHGKGIGNLRRTVHALLDRHPAVLRYRLGGHGAGGWGATLVDLRPGPPDDDAASS